MGVAQNAIFLSPGRTDSRRELGELMVQTGKQYEGLAVLAVNSDDGGLSATCGTDADAALRDAQRGLMMHPGELRNWQTLAYVRCKTSTA